MRLTLRPRPRRPRAISHEGGFTMVEITVGIFLISIGMMGIATSTDAFQKLISSSSKRTVAAHVAEQEVEQLASIGYKDLVLASNPGSSADPKDPRSGVSGSQYRPSSDAAAPGPPDQRDQHRRACAPTRSWSEDGVSGTVYRFITKNSSGSCGTNCPKRVTVAVTMNTAAGNKPDPVTTSTVVSEAQDQNADENTAEPPPPPGPSYVTFYPTDTKAAPPLPGTRVEPSSSHVVHESDKFPDLMVTDPPPNPSAPASPPLYKFSNPLDVYTAAEFPGGRIIRKDSNCDNFGDKNKVHWWVTKPLPTNVSLTGNVGGTLFTQVLGQLPGNVILCLRVYKVATPLKATGEFDGGLTNLNGKNCAGQDIRVTSEAEPYPESAGNPIVPRAVSLSGHFLGCNILSYQIAQNQRIAVAMTVRDKRPKDDRAARFPRHPRLRRGGALRPLRLPVHAPARDDRTGGSVMTWPTTRMCDERGFASVTALVTMIVMLSVAGAVFSGSVQLSNSSNKDDAGQRAYQAAVAGVNTAVSRLDSLKPTNAQCITNATTPPQVPASGSWCPEIAQESLGKKQLFSYRVSIAPPSGGQCAGDPLDNPSTPAVENGDRCVVAVGDVNGVKRTVAARLGMTSGSTPFANTTSVVGYKDVILKKGSTVNSNIGVNKNFKSKGATLNGTLTLGPKGKAKDYTGPRVVNASDFFPAPVSFFNPPGSTDPADDTAIDNYNTINGVTPRMTPVVAPTTYVHSTRTLTVGAGKNVTLPGTGLKDAAGLPIPAYYNFCKLVLGTGAKITIPKDTWVRLYIDSRDRAGSRCANIGELKAGKDSSFVNGNSDPRSLQIFAWSKKTKLTIPNKDAFAGLIYAPNSKVKFSGKGKLTGGVAGQKVEIRKDMIVQSSALLNAYTIPSLAASQVSAWRQCQSYFPLSGASPASKC